jgi:cell division inhibitor SulA
LSEAQIREASLKSLEVLDELGDKVRWLHSYVTDDKIYCVYLAPDEATIREHAKRIGLPANRIAAVRRLLDPVNFH